MTVQFNLAKWFNYLTASLKTVQGKKQQFPHIRRIHGENAITLDCGHALMELAIVGQEVCMRHNGKLHHDNNRETVQLWQNLIRLVS